MIDTKLLRQKILDLAIRGKLVPQDPNDEPASVLLERIRKEKAELVKQGKVKKGKHDSFVYTSDNRHYEKLAFEVPSNWAWVRVIDCCLGQETKLPSGEYFDYIDIDAIDNKNHRIDKPKHLLTSNAPSRAAKGVQSGDTLFSIVRPYLENIAFVSNEYAHCIASTGFYVLKPNRQLLLPQYLFLFFTTKFAIDGLNDFMKGDNSPSIRKEHMDTFLVPIPPIDEQARIIEQTEAMLSLAIDIKESQAELSDLAALAKSKILDLAMHGKLVPQDPNDEPASELLARVSTSHKSHYEKVKNPPYEIPRNWTWIRLDNVCWLDKGREHCGEKLPYLEARYLRGKKEAVLQDGGIILNAGDRVILVDGENSGEVFDIAERGYMGSTFRILNQSSIVNAEFLQFFLDLHRKMFRDNKTGSAIPHLNKKIFANLPIAIPPLKEQQRIVYAVRSIVEQLDLLE